MLGEVPVDSFWLEFFEPLSERKNVYELDKFVGLLTLFRRMFSGNAYHPYSYLNSIRDNFTALKLNGRERYLLI